MRTSSTHPGCQLMLQPLLGVTPASFHATIISLCVQQAEQKHQHSLSIPVSAVLLSAFFRYQYMYVVFGTLPELPSVRLFDSTADNI